MKFLANYFHDFYFKIHVPPQLEFWSLDDTLTFCLLRFGLEWNTCKTYSERHQQSALAVLCLVLIINIKINKVSFEQQHADTVILSMLAS